MLTLICVASLAVSSGLFVKLVLDRDKPGKGVGDQTLSTLNIAGEDGVKRFILSNSAPMAPIQGELIARTVPPGMSGMIFTDPKGNEVGGIGVSSRHTTVALDYRDTPIEAIGLATYQGKTGQSAMLKVMDNPKETVDVKKIKVNDPDEIKKLQSLMVDRITLGVEENVASLVIKDREGKERILIGVDNKDQPYIKVLDKDGLEIDARGKTTAK
ncbi:MAG: hypothetical protein E6Q34_09885 [Burkholderiaceae bacterium]|nr:MAG: hypothetical protein E6Q34_09885 [Burkholderiaceae bacterium]